MHTHTHTAAWPQRTWPFSEFTVGRSIPDLPVNAPASNSIAAFSMIHLVYDRGPRPRVNYDRTDYRILREKAEPGNYRSTLSFLYFDSRVSTEPRVYGGDSVFDQDRKWNVRLDDQRWTATRRDAVGCALIVYATRIESPLNDSSDPIDLEIGYKR